MLGKLLKHEIKATARLLLPLYLILIVFTILERVALGLKIFKGVLVVIPGFITFIFIVANIAIIMVSSIFVIYRFYKNLITDEGYLMFTLPAKPYQLINSKLIISTFWTFLSVIAVIASLLLVFGTSRQFDFLWDELKYMSDEMTNETGIKGSILLIEFIVSMVIGTISNILMIYASIAVGQLFNGHKVLGSIAAYIAIYTALQIGSTVIVLAVVFLSGSSIENTKIIYQIILPLTCIITFVIDVAFYIVTDYLFNKKLNLE